MMNFVSPRFDPTSYLVFFRNEVRIFLVRARRNGMLTIRPRLGGILFDVRGLSRAGQPTAVSPGGPGFSPTNVA